MVKGAMSGTIRMGKNFKAYEYKNKEWTISKKGFPETIKVIQLFKAHNKFNELIAQKNLKFLKGQLYKNKTQGARINICRRERN